MMNGYTYKSKVLYIEDIQRIAYELMDDCTTIEKLSDVDAQKLVAIMTGIKIMSDRIIDEIKKDKIEIEG